MPHNANAHPGTAPTVPQISDRAERSSNGNAYSSAAVPALPAKWTGRGPNPRCARAGRTAPRTRSRARIMATSHHGTISRQASATTATRIKSRSAAGSSIWPSRDIWLNRLAISPSSQSLTPETASTTNAQPSWCPTTRSAKTGTSNTRRKLIAFGTVNTVSRTCPSPATTPPEAVLTTSSTRPPAGLILRAWRRFEPDRPGCEVGNPQGDRHRVPRLQTGSATAGHHCRFLQLDGVRLQGDAVERLPHVRLEHGSLDPVGALPRHLGREPSSRGHLHAECRQGGLDPAGYVAPVVQGQAGLQAVPVDQASQRGGDVRIGRSDRRVGGERG